ncbi:biosynthetic-type acetolactate synthase large subunit [Coraliomargarita akajimensis]|uniref:Acetolactate synthase n=1 Tax=Coraliomargarita akajimensis (strain DSM 45221 / IAM 15411 / JCM 23193 / KCTC 12865 / 04OKA010-24) TaxID=583355 RepID=D5EHQ1_CORAD|nr:biosynthetic-type acetolactate synthase large subunit [Coraliomargarita akajimensis]ADE54092.1 acetolactate synthase, large subunit, biosynthetic type [Coraliomargarita akajimensis DSM 45221]
MKTKEAIEFPKQDQIGPEMKGADVMVAALEREGVDVVYAYPGGASLELHQALTKSKQIRTILPRMEQGGGFMAQGHARVTGKPAVCMATSGPGATNLVTCIADAFMDSIPLIAITGQVYQQFIGKAAFQETDFYGMTLPIVKHSYLVLDKEDLPRVIKEAFHIASTGRPGPVVIDIPKDVQQAIFTPTFPDEVDLPGYKDDKTAPLAEDEELAPVLDLIQEAKRPVLYIGGGIISGEAHKELREFAELTGLPVASTLMGLGAFDAQHPQSLYWFGMHGTVAGNWAVCDSDLLICAGARFDDRITGKVDKFAPDATIVHIDIDASEHNKNKRVQYAIHSEIKHALTRLIELSKNETFSKPDLSEWMTQIAEWKAQYPFTYDKGEHITQQEAIETLYEITNGDAIITTGVGQHQMWAAQFYKFREPRTYISSLGLGTMGFGLPAALGAKVACPDREVINIDGDGCFLMNVQELATAKIEKINAKTIILNNQHLGMVVQWEDLMYDSVRGQTILCDHDNIGGPDNVDALYPDFVTMAAGFGVAGRRVVKREDLRDAINEMLAHDGPYVLEVIVPYTEHVLPMIKQGLSAKEILITSE